MNLGIQLNALELKEACPCPSSTVPPLRVSVVAAVSPLPRRCLASPLVHPSPQVFIATP
jgi:hypothetical protein